MKFPLLGLFLTTSRSALSRSENKESNGTEWLMKSSSLVTLLLLLLSPFAVLAQVKDQKPDTPVEKWTGKTVMLIGAHADDDALSHGTLAMLQAHGNQVYVVTLTTGNVGTQDPNLSRTQLAQIRKRNWLH